MDTASGEVKQSELEDVTVALYWSAVWEHFGFSMSYVDGDKKVVDKSVTVQALCATHVVCASINTSDMSAETSPQFVN